MSEVADTEVNFTADDSGEQQFERCGTVCGMAQLPRLLQYQTSLPCALFQRRHETLELPMFLCSRTYNNPEYEFHNFSYEKQADGARLLMLTSSLDVTVCSHAHSTVDATTYPCTNYVGALCGPSEAQAGDVLKGRCGG